MALHHKICHTLGGAFGLDHAETHAVMLPHTVAFNEAAVPDLLAPAGHALAAAAAGPGLYDLAKRIGAPTSLQEIGMAEADLDRAATLASARPYWNPRPVTEAAIRQLLDEAWNGQRPAA
jgi:maleylacetate reductase